jgi:APA family basic amino acid/polyamine antiporter
MEEAFFQRDKFTVSAGQLVAVGIVTLLTLLNCRGVRVGKWVQNIFAVAKTLALIVLIVVGLTVARNPDAILHNMQDVREGAYQTPRYDVVEKLIGSAGLLIALMVGGGAMVGSLFSADAWNNVTFTAGEVRNPRRNLPFSLVFGTGMVIALYLLANLAYLAALPVDGEPSLVNQVRNLTKRAAELDLAGNKDAAQACRAEIDSLLEGASTFDRGIAYAKDDRVATATLQRVAPTLGVPLMAIAIMISTFGCVNGMTLMGARLYYAMAQDRLFFRSVGELNSRGVPAAGLVLQGLWSLLLIFSGTYNELLDYVMFAALLFYVLTVTGLFVLRRTRPEAERPYRAFGYPVIPAVYVFLCAAIMLDLLVVKPVYTWPGLIIVLAGIPVYFLWRATARLAKVN